MPITIAAKEISQPVFASAGSLITVTPGSGATVTVEYTLGDRSAVRNGVATWSAWTKGAASSITSDLLGDDAYLRITSTGGSASVDIDPTPSGARLQAYRTDWGAPGGSGIGGNSTTSMQKNIPASGAGSISSSTYARTRAAIARVKAKAGNMRIGLLGDSTQAGAYALGAGTVWAGNRAVSHAPYFAAALNSKDMPAISSSFFGDQNISGGATTPQYDPRVTWGAGWGVSSAKSLGANMQYNNTTTNALTFLPTTEVDTFEIYYAVTAGAAQFTVSRAGDATSGIIDSAGANGIGKYTFTGALGGANAISIQRNGVGGGLFIIGINAFNSAESAIQCFNWGWNSGMVSDWVSTAFAYSHLPGMVACPCDHYIITYGINEWNGAITPATSFANLATIIDTVLPYGDVSLCTGYPSAKSAKTLAEQKVYIDGLYAVAAARGLVVNDVWQKVGSYEQGNAFGFYANTLHPVTKLYQLKAESDASMILAL